MNFLTVEISILWAGTGIFIVELIVYFVVKRKRQKAYAEACYLVHGHF